MTLDMSQFYQVFFEETEEHLASMESLLLELNVDQPDVDDLNAIFRAAHSIKGGSGTFGFADMAQVTHILENLLDLLRKEQLQPTTEMVNAFLSSVDVIKEQLEAHRAGNTADPQAATDTCERLTLLTGGEVKAETKETSPATPDPPASAAVDKLHYRIHLSHTDSKSSGAEAVKLDVLLDDLRQAGEITDLHMERGEASFRLAIALSAAEIREMLAFFVQAEDVRIVQEDAPQKGQPLQTPVLSFVEGTEAYGFFETDEEIAAHKEEADGYGFFVAEEALQSQRENAQGYGFFTDVPEKSRTVTDSSSPEEISTAGNASPPQRRATDQPHPLRRATDQPNPQRRASDQKPSAPADASSIRVSVEKVDQLINLVGELVITQAMLAQTASEVEVDPVLQEKLLDGITLLERNTRDLQESVMSIRMLPMSFVFSRFPRMVRETAVKLNKDVRFVTFGESTELDKGLIEKITDPLTHLVRNSLDHGIETPETRISQGKPSQGTLTLRAFHQGGNVVIEVQDDGAGLNREKILAKARERDLNVSEQMSDQDAWLLIFAPGFSTADQVTDVSGRGVGMDVVKRNIESLGGRVEIESYTGVGTKMTIRLPLTLAILDGLSIDVGGEVFITPLTSIVESLQPQPADIKTVAGQGRVVHVRGDYLPLIPLYGVFGIEPRSRRPEDGTLMIIEADGLKTALLVDELLGQHQVVIKSLETNFRKVDGISGATIMGDGRVALILDVGTLVRMGKIPWPDAHEEPGFKSMAAH